MSDLPQAQRNAISCFNFKYYILLLSYIIIGIMPFIKLIVDFWTSVIYFNYDEKWITEEGTRNKPLKNIHFLGLMSLLLLLFSTRSYVVLFCGTMDNRSIFMENDITKNLYRIIPFIGAPVAELIHEKYCFSCL